MAASTTSTEPNSKYRFSVFLLVLTTILWGTTFIITKTLTNTIPLFLYLGIRFFLAGIFFIPFRKHFRGITKKEIGISAKAGALFFLSQITQTIGLHYTTVAKAGFITGLNVLMVPVFLAIFWKKKASKLLWLGVILAILGIAFLSFMDSGTGLMELTGLNIGDILIIICAIFYAFYLIYVDKYLFKIDVIAFSSLQILIVSGYCLVGSFIFDDWNFILHTGTDQIFTWFNILIIIYISFGATSGSLMTQFNGQKYMNNTTKSAIIYALEPVFATMFGIIFGDEVITNSVIIGSAFIFIGIIISQLHPKNST